MTRKLQIFQKTSFLVFTFLLITNYSLSQNLFDEKFEGCKTSHFVVESDTISINTVDQDVVTILANSFKKEVRTDIRGILSIQILVDQEGNSCVLSVENKTNIKTDELDIKSIIDEKLKWTIPEENKSVIVSIKFYGDSVELKRIGLNADKGFHELLK